MLAMMSVIANYTLKNVFLTFYILQAMPPKRRGARGNLPPYSPSRWAWCVKKGVN